MVLLPDEYKGHFAMHTLLLPNGKESLIIFWNPQNNLDRHQKLIIFSLGFVQSFCDM